MQLDQEIKYFDEQLSELLQHHEGKYALIKGEELIGVYDSEKSAFEAGIKALGVSSFLIRQIIKEDPVHQVPALTHGLINVHS